MRSQDNQTFFIHCIFILNNFSLENVVTKRSQLAFIFQNEVLVQSPLEHNSELIPRRANKSYKNPNMNVVLNEGTNVLLLIAGAQRDSRYYSVPDRFDPKRISDASKTHPELR